MPYAFLVVEQIDKNSSYKLHLKLIAAVALPAASLLYTQLRCLTRAQHFTRCSAALLVCSTLHAA